MHVPYTSKGRILLRKGEKMRQHENKRQTSVSEVQKDFPKSRKEKEQYYFQKNTCHNILLPLVLNIKRKLKEFEL